MRASTVVLLALSSLCAVTAGGCGGARTEAPSPSARPLSIPVTLIAASGAVEARRGGRWERLEEGRPATGATELRAKGGAAALAIGGGERAPAGKLWLRDESTVATAEDAAGQLVVELVRGEARLRVGGGGHGARLVSSGEAVDASGKDLLARRRDGAGTVAATATQLDAAGWAMAIGAARAAAGIGSLETRPTSGDGVARLELRGVHVAARVAGDVAETRVEHVFHNASAERLEGTFRFPLPDRAVLIGLAMEIDGRMMEGELAELEKARKTYDSIVDSMQDPALLEWEHGNTFKLRVFPIEPSSDKRIVLRYVSPLRRDGDRWEYAYPTAAPDLEDSIGRFHLELEGDTVVHEERFVPGREISAPVPRAPAAVLRESRPDATYTAVRVRPSFASVRPAPGTAPPSRVRIVVLDTSRSSLEERGLALDSLGALLEELQPADRFLVVASDVTARDHAPAPVAPAPESLAAAARFVEAIEPDGASDLGLALRHAGALAARARAEQPSAAVEVVYVGDGLPTWGETGGPALEAIARSELAGAVLHALTLGKDASEERMRELAGATGGWTARPRALEDARRFAFLIDRAHEVRALGEVRVTGGAKDEVLLGSRTALEGEELEVLIRTPAGETTPASLTLVATASGEEVRQEIPIGPAAATPHLGRRWAARRIADLEEDGAKAKEAIVKLSLDAGVMSKHTAFLVLESEEAYERHGIERRQAKRQAEGEPRVSGADLESVGEQRAQLGMDRIQPGDPEIHVPAPADARSVVMVFPFGDTKIAVYEPERREWTVRFLIDAGTPDGAYEVLVRITHADGRVELIRLPYVVDTTAPAVAIALRAAGGRPGSYEVRASQVLDEAEVRRALPPALRERPVAELRRRFGARVADLSRVEVRFPDGAILPLDATEPGELVGTWTPATAPEGEVELHVVAVDRALNQSATRLWLAPGAR